MQSKRGGASGPSVCAAIGRRAVGPVGGGSVASRARAGSAVAGVSASGRVGLGGTAGREDIAGGGCAAVGLA